MRSKTLIQVLTALLIPVLFYFVMSGFKKSNNTKQQESTIQLSQSGSKDFIGGIRDKTMEFDSPNVNENFQQSKINILSLSERVIINITEKDEDNILNNHYYKRTAGYYEKEKDGRTVLYASSGNYADGKEPMQACFIAQNISGRLTFSEDSAGTRWYYIKPKMRIRKGDFSPVDIRPVIAVVTHGYSGRQVDSTIIRVRNFSDMNGEYSGSYKEKYMTENEMPGINLLKPSKLFKGADNKPSKFDIKIYWFGDVDVWFDKLTVDDERADRLFDHGNDAHIVSETTAEAFLMMALKIKNGEYKESNYMPVNYIMNIMYKHLQNGVLPAP